ncbi:MULTISPECIES: Lrp/AsnC family transcriptional regulator [Haloferax]|uniref:AsnC family transcriptional regulator n=1 Tax=Haloferax marinum TaxID=2666143 RepID=A0A6A8G6T6_9EURY|nr:MULTISPECIES: Lrp/AsnC family transcriptional regulator [Haloferax]KAB1197244.1 AsnC family transcriptional regulator [Haloferax sp. CBA1150]MRW96282.1 AsnC family transcriptional regulator [Haloferax marinum]
MPYRNIDHRLDEIDRRILHALMDDARDTSASALAAAAGVSGATIRNRIHKLEDVGIIRGYNTQVDFELAGGKLTNLYLCDVPVTERQAAAYEARAIPGVINVRTLMTGRRNLHVLAVGESTSDLRRIARRLTDIGIHIEDEDLVEEEIFAPYGPFDPNDGDQTPEANDFISLTGNASVVEVTVQSDAPIANLALEEAARQGILDEDTLVIAIERDDRELTPHGDTIVSPDDIVTILSRAGEDGDALSAFREPRRESESESESESATQ